MRLDVLKAGVVVLGLLAAAGAHAAKAPFGPKDLFSLQQAIDPQIRPDGGAVAYVRASEDIMIDDARRSIWLVDSKTLSQTPLSSPEWPAYGPQWSPDGERLAYVSIRDGRARVTILVVKTGARAEITDLPEAPRDLSWSPNGEWIAFSMLTEEPPPVIAPPLVKPDGAKWAEPLKVIEALTYRADGQGYLKPGFDHLFVVSAVGGAVRQLTFGAFNERGRVGWTPDSKAMVFSANHEKDWAREPEVSSVFELDLDSGQLRQLTTRVGPNGDPIVSPDGRSIAYLGFKERHRGYENVELSIMGRDGAGARSLTAGLDRSIQSARWSQDGQSLFVDYVDHGETRLAEVDLAGKVRVLASGMSGQELDRPYSGGSFSVGGRNTIAFTFGGPGVPGDVGVFEHGAVRRLTELNAALFADRALGDVSHLAVLSSFDQKAVDAWIITPPGFDPGVKHPLILEIHGGPFASYGPVFSSELQLYASAGYVVVYANPRGSTSYGFNFADEINDNYPSHDYDDLMSVVDAAIARGGVDPKALYVTGGSGGGLLTAWIVGKTQRFQAAAAQKPVINWTSEVLTVDSYVEQAQNWFGKYPWEDQAQYWRRSPLSLVGAVSTPTLLMVGAEDRRTPPSEAEQYYQALQLRAVPTALVRVPGASHHGLAERPSQEAQEAAVILAWFARYRPPPAP